MTRYPPAKSMPSPWVNKRQSGFGNYGLGDISQGVMAPTSDVLTKQNLEHVGYVAG